MADKTMTTSRPQELTERTNGERRRPVVRPPADIFESERAFHLQMDLPGADRDSVEITIDRNVLTVRARRAAEDAREGLAPVWREYEEADYERSFTLGTGVDREHVEATVKHGVLSLVLPKAKEAQPRRIQVKAG